MGVEISHFGVMDEDGDGDGDRDGDGGAAH